MSSREQIMRDKGKRKVYKTIFTKAGNLKQVSSTQLGQQMLLEDAVRILPYVREWIKKGSGVNYRKELIDYFDTDEILLEKVVQSFLYLSGAIYTESSEGGKKRLKTRHKKINTVKNKVLPDLSFDQVWRFIEIIIHFSKYFEVEKLLHYRESGFNWNLKYTTTLSEDILEKLAGEAAEAFYPMPTTEPPLPWRYDNGELTGGYREFQYPLIRTTEEIDYSLYSTQIFKAANYIQSVPWIVNTEVLKQVKIDLETPRKEDYIKSPYPDDRGTRWDVDLKGNTTTLSKKEISEITSIRKDFRERVALYRAETGDYESAAGKFRAKRLAVQIAERYIGETIWFPHSYDFRGRIYPLPIGLSPQGSDAVKALLLYKNTEALSERGSLWNWAYLSSLYGEDKLPFNQRVERGKELINAHYKDADEPYQFLSHQLELKKWIADDSYIPRTRIHLDACNSGSQFTSAITGDKEGCLATNVIPTYGKDGLQTRQDAYLLVADKALSNVLNQLAESEDGSLDLFKNLLLSHGRKICKTPVMVSNYGGTSGGRADIIWTLLRELNVERKFITKSVAQRFSKIIGDSIHGVLKGGKAFERYIHQMNNVLTKVDKPIVWTTADGFRVVHVKNKELKAKQVNCLLPGARKKTTITKKMYSKRVSPAKMRLAISPNYIHSLDAELLRRVANKMSIVGIKDSDWIHDSFGCHPNHVDKMLHLTKKEFMKLVRKRPLKFLDQELRDQSPDDRDSQRALRDIKVPRLRGFYDREGGLDIVMDSDWFFS